MKFTDAFQNFLNLLQNFFDEYYKQCKTPENLWKKIKTYEGGRYIKVATFYGDNCGESVYAFVEKETGAIFKPAGWKAPAKHARGNIFDQNPISCCNPHGVKYLK